MQMYASIVPDPALSGPPFVLAHTDLNFQNILVDGEGNVTGIIDWDDMLVGPRQSGCCQYPSWITRDWDPKMYGYYRHSDGSRSEVRKYACPICTPLILFVLERCQLIRARLVRRGLSRKAIDIPVITTARHHR
jgi:hypothetical protein